MPALQRLGVPVDERLLFLVQGQVAIHLPLDEGSGTVAADTSGVTDFRLTRGSLVMVDMPQL